MRGTKLTERPINLSWNTTKEIYQAIKFIAPMYGEAFNYFPAYCCKKWLHDPTIYSIDKARSCCVTVYVDATLKNKLDNAASTHELTRSEIIHSCVKREVYTRIAAWGCKTPDEFVSLMTSKTPLKFIEEINNRNVQVAA
jgi:rhamnose utilization protein RhaD (predicted bifunctional aldolase and dehydrogenase)